MNSSSVDKIFENIKGSMSTIPVDRVEALELYIKSSEEIMNIFNENDKNDMLFDIQGLNMAISIMKSEVTRLKRIKYLKYGACTAFVSVGLGYIVYRFFR